MQQVYEAVYGDMELSEIVCGVTVSAYGKLADQYGQGTEAQSYSTTIDRAMADRINWAEPYMADFPKVWTLNYVHPSVEAVIAQQEAKDALDCAVDEGLFDVDMLCP